MHMWCSTTFRNAAIRQTVWQQFQEDALAVPERSWAEKVGAGRLTAGMVDGSGPHEQ